MDPARIADLLTPFLGSIRDIPDLLPHISTYIDILVRWNARINLTAIRDPEDIVTRHFGESLFAASHLFPKSERSSALKGYAVADIGSGAGFPGLPLKLWAPEIALTLIESNHKKSAFIKEVTRALTLIDVNIENVRAEAVTARYDLVTLRAVERFESVLPTAPALVAPAGRLALLVGAAQQSEAHSTLPDLHWSSPIPVPESRSRILLLAHRAK